MRQRRDIHKDYDHETLHDERQYGFYWYSGLWRILRPVLIFAAALLIDGESLTEGTSVEDICRQTALPESAVMQYINSFCKI